MSSAPALPQRGSSGFFSRQGFGLATLALATSLLAAPITALAQESSSGTLYAPPITTLPTTGTTAGTTSSSSSSGGSSLNTICGTTLSQAANPTAADTASLTYTQKVQYCQAAQQAQKAASDDNLLWKVWAGVAGICATACITSFTGAEHLKMVCTATNIGATVTDAVMTQNFAGSLMNLAPTALGFLKKGKGKDLAACLSAATATMQVFTKRKDETSQVATENANLASAQQLGDSTTGSSSSGTTGPASAIVPTSNNTPSSTTATSAAVPLTVEKGTNFAQTGGAGNPCATQGFACALAKDGNLPSFVGTPEFTSQLAKNTGLDPNQYLSGDQTPAQSILGASGGAGLNAEGVQGYAGLLADAAKAFDSETPNATYAGGGGGGGASHSGGGGDDGMATVVAGLMKSLNPHAGDGKEKDDGNSMNVIFQGDRAPSTYNADDPKFSIFDRVSYRYRNVCPRILQ